MPPVQATSPRPATILHVLPADQARGAQVVARDICNALNDRPDGHLALAIFEAAGPGALRPDVSLEVPSGRARALGFDARAWLALRRELARVRPDVVAAHGGEALKYVALAAGSRTPIIYAKVGGSAHALGAGTRWLWRVLARRARLVVAISDEMVAEAEALLGVPRDRIMLVGNGRDPARFYPDPARVDGDGLFRIAWVGALNADKRPLAFVEMVRTLRRRGVACSGSLVGDGPLAAEVASAAPGSGVEILGGRADIPTILRDHDLLVMTSAVEGMPGVLIEAGLTALPVVTTEVPGARAVVADGETGLVVPVDDAEALLEAVAALAADQDRRRAMGSEARRRCSSRFTIETSAAGWAIAVDRALGRDDRVSRT